MGAKGIFSRGVYFPRTIRQGSRTMEPGRLRGQSSALEGSFLFEVFMSQSMSQSAEIDPVSLLGDPVSSPRGLSPGALLPDHGGAPTTLRQAVGRRSTQMALGLLLLVLGLLYWRILAKLVYDWSTIGDESHGFLVPFFSLFLLWDKRKALAAMRLQPSWAGLPVVFFGCFTLLLGVYGAELFLSRISLVLIIAGLVWMLCGGAILRAVLFPLGVLLLAIPFPTILFSQITFPLQLLASELASSALPLFGVPVFREGNVIQLPAMKLEVAQACSGIRSLMSLFTLSVFYGYFLERTTGRRWLMALASIPIAVGANALRIVGTGLCVQYWDPSKGEGFFHEFSGWVMFLISLSFLYFVHRALGVLRPAGKHA